MSMHAGTQYSVGSCTRVCAASGRAFVPGDRYVGVLAQSRSNGEMMRLDYDERAWRDGARPEGAALLGVWRGVAVAGGERRRTFIDDDELLDMFRSTDPASDSSAETELASGGSGAERRALRLVLALILLRKRVLVQEGTEGGAMLVRVRGNARPPTGPAYERVESMNVGESMVEAVSRELDAVLLDGEGERPGSTGKGGSST